MKSTVEIESGKAGEMHRVLEQSLESSGKIRQQIENEDERLKVSIETESLGQLRGCTDTVFRLGSLSKKILER